MILFSQNLHGYAETNIYLNLEKIARTIVQREVEVICLQEVCQYELDYLDENGIRSSNLANILIKILKERYNMNYHSHIHMFKKSWDVMEEGLAIISKFPIIEFENIQISENNNFNSWETRFCIKTKLDTSTGNIDLYNLHLGWDSDTENATEQINKLAIHTNKSDNFIVAGDFNLDRNSKLYSHLLDVGLKDVIEEFDYDYSLRKTFIPTESNLPTGRIDYIMSNKLICENVSYEFELDTISDHVGIIVDLNKEYNGND